MRKIFLLLFAFLSLQVFPNSMSPYREGSFNAEILLSSQVSILDEYIYIEINEDFTKAWFSIDYRIKNTEKGSIIPLLFYAPNFEDEFIFILDGKSQNSLNMLTDSRWFDRALLYDFKYFTQYFDTTGNKTYTIFPLEFEEGGWNSAVSPDDLFYIECFLDTGIHTTHVEYEAKAWTNLKGWINKYYFTYSLAPAKYWKSFGKLTVELNAEKFSEEIICNLGEPVSGNINSTAIWQFNSIPADNIYIRFEPEANFFAKILIFLDPIGITAIINLIIFFFIARRIKKWRRKNPNRACWPMYLIGAFIIPLTIVFPYIFSYDIIRTAIGEHGNNYQYSIYMIFTIPIFLPLTLIFTIILDFIIAGFLKRKLKKQTTQDFHP